MNSNDYLLISQMSEGNTKAFKELYYTYAKAIHTNIAKIIKDEETINDLMQEVFLALWENRQKIDAQKGVAPWLYAVSYNKAIKYFRNKIKAELAEKNPSFLNLFVAEPEDDKTNEATLLHIVYEAVTQLSERKRVAFSEYRLKGKPLNQVADEMGISKETVKGYLKDARKDILQYIQDRQSSLPPAVLSLLFLIFIF